MSSKAKLIVIISFFLIAVLLASVFGYRMIFNKKTSEVLATTTEVKEANKGNENIENEEVIVVILNKKETAENTEQNNEEEPKEKQNNEQGNQEEQNNEPINETQNTTNNNVEQSSNQVIQNTDSFYIKINYGANVVTVYTKDLNGNYTVPYKAFTCSTGTATPTSGIYNIDYKYRWLDLFENVYGQYCTRIVGNILFHSVPYLEKGNPASLEYWEYDKLRNFCFCWMHKVNSRRC